MHIDQDTLARLVALDRQALSPHADTVSAEQSLCAAFRAALADLGFDALGHAICFDCGCVFGSDTDDPLCPECHPVAAAPGPAPAKD